MNLFNGKRYKALKAKLYKLNHEELITEIIEVIREIVDKVLEDIKEKK